MSVLLAAADETAGRGPDSLFSFGGFVAPVFDWDDWFIPAWEERVLAGPPRIDYLHVTEMRSRAWRERHGLSLGTSERRIDEATRIIASTGALFPVTSSISRRDFETLLARPLGARPTFRVALKSPDYMCFVAYVLSVLASASVQFRDVEKINFVVERNGKVTKHIAFFHGQISTILKGIDRPDLIPLVGGLFTAGKGYVPLQAADILCWHLQRSDDGNLDRIDAKRLSQLAHRPGHRHRWTTAELTKLSAELGVLGHRPRRG